MRASCTGASTVVARQLALARQSCDPTVKVGIVTAALDEGAAADAPWRLCAVAQMRGQPAGGAVRADLQVRSGCH